MKPIKVRNIGNSVGIILPKESGLTNGDIIQAKKSDLFILDTSEITRGHNRKLVEDSFADFEKELMKWRIWWWLKIIVELQVRF